MLADTERYGHLPAFNQTFAEFGLPVQWSEEEYGRRLRIGGGKERMASLLTPDFVAAAGLPTDAEGQQAEVASWHARKTAIYTEMVAEGSCRPDPGSAGSSVRRSQPAGSWPCLHLGRGVRAGDPGPRRGRGAGRTLRPILAGDVVATRSRRRTSICWRSSGWESPRADVVVIEDSGNGAAAAAAAGLTCVVTVNDYTRDEAFPDAVLVVTRSGTRDCRRSACWGTAAPLDPMGA